MWLSKAIASVLGILLLVAGLPSLVGAQHAGHGGKTIEDEDNTITITDPAQDVVVNVAARTGGPSQNGSSMGNYFDHLDILKVVFGDETESSFKIYLYMKSLTPSQLPGFPQRQVLFSYGKVDWRVFIGGCGGRGGQPGGGGSSAPTTACLGFRDGGARDYRSVGPTPMEVKADLSAFVVTIDKTKIFNENRVVVRFGDSLKNLTAQASQTYADTRWVPNDPLGGVQAIDRAPGSGVFPDDFVFVRGSNGRGHLALSSADQIRVSNGEATTIVYKVDLFNHATEEMSVQLETQDLRSDWTARVPSLLKVPPQTSLTFPVILALPFTHDHGRTATFKVVAQSVEDTNSVAYLDLGVFWTDVPQPSSHHNGELWFHSAPQDVGNELFQPLFSPVMGWINSIETDPDPEATDANIPAFSNEGLGCVFFNVQNCGIPPQSRASWFLPLSPRLLIGLDFDVTRDGLLILDILPKVPASTARLTAKVLYCDPTASGGSGGRGLGQNQTCYNYSIVLAQGEVTQPLSANSVAHYEIPLSIEQAADLMPYQKGANFGLRLELTSDTPQNLFFTEPRPEVVTKKSKLFLPLFEYHDPVDQAFQNVGSLSLVPVTPFEKKVNPGETAVYSFDLTNKADGEQELEVLVQGVNHEWSHLVTAPEFKLKPRQNTTIQVAVTAPDDAQDEERAELFLVVHNPRDESIVTVTRMRATVTTNEDIEDESGALGGDAEDTPGPAGILAVLALVGAVFLRRRRA